MVFKKYLTGLFLFIPAYNLCMENNSGKQEVEQIAPKLPMEEFLNKTVTQHLVNLIKEYENSKDENRLKIFLKQFLDLQLINKQVKNFLVESDGKKIKYFAPYEPLLTVAAQLNSNILCELILQHSTATQNELNYALIFAATNQNKKIFDLLIDHGAKDVILNSKNIQTTSIALLKNGSSVLNDYCRTLLLSAFGGEYLFTKFLVINSTNVNCRSANLSRTVLHEAVVGKYSVEYKSELLLKYGADPNLRDYAGDTPLMLAAFAGNKKMCALLLKYGADKTIKSENETAYDIAMKNNYFEVAALLS